MMEILAFICLCIIYFWSTFIISNESKIIIGLRKQNEELQDRNNLLTNECRRLLEEQGLLKRKSVEFVSQIARKDINTRRLVEKDDNVLNSLNLINQCADIIRGIVQDRSTSE